MCLRYIKSQKTLNEILDKEKKSDTVTQINDGHDSSNKLVMAKHFNYFFTNVGETQ